MEMQPNDHDLLIELRTEMQGLREDVRDLSSNTKARITTLEMTKVDKEIFDDHLEASSDHERRIRILEKALYVGLGFLVLLQIELRYFTP